VEIPLTTADALTWDYAWRNARPPWLTVPFGYLHFFLVASRVHDMPSPPSWSWDPAFFERALSEAKGKVCSARFRGRKAAIEVRKEGALATHPPTMPAAVER
jgi:hypothetical protein